MLFLGRLKGCFGKKRNNQQENNYQKKISYRDKEQFLIEIEEAKRELQLAEDVFNNADEQFIDLAVKRLDYARYKLNVLLRHYKDVSTK